MGVIKADEPPAARVVEGKAVLDSVRNLFRRFHELHVEFCPIAPAHLESFTIQIEQMKQFVVFGHGTPQGIRLGRMAASSSYVINR